MSSLSDTLTFGFEQTYTISEWWTESGFTHVSDTPLKRKKMLELATAIAQELNGSFRESLDIWNHLQYETFDQNEKASFVVTMDPGSIEVKTPPVLIHEIEAMATPLVIAAEKVKLVPYRNWWYGIKAGTEGGCHINLGGFTPESNPLIKNPELVIKYAAYLHNRPWLTYPFMGPDVGPEGNAMRMDEKPGFEFIQQKMNDYILQIKSGKKLDAQQTYDFFKDTNLITEKASAPSLYKFKAPLYFIEDRAQESLRSAKEFTLVANMRLKILEFLQTQEYPEELKVFTDLHKVELTSYSLWGYFLNWANELELNPINYQRFFDRQFPLLSFGTNQPKKFGIKEGRRPRVITNIQKRGNTIISKTIDTTYKRLEVFYATQVVEHFQFEVIGDGIEYVSPTFKHKGYLAFGEIGKSFFAFIDIKYNKENPILTINLKDNDAVIETATFNVNDMMWV